MHPKGVYIPRARLSLDDTKQHRKGLNSIYYTVRINTEIFLNLNHNKRVPVLRRPINTRYTVSIGNLDIQINHVSSSPTISKTTANT